MTQNSRLSVIFKINDKEGINLLESYQITSCSDISSRENSFSRSDTCKTAISIEVIIENKDVVGSRTSLIVCRSNSKELSILVHWELVINRTLNFPISERPYVFTPHEYFSDFCIFLIIFIRVRSQVNILLWHIH